MLIIFQRLISLPHDTSIMGSLGPLVPSSRSFKEKEMAAHSSILTWRIPWTEEPGGPQSMVLQELDLTYQLNRPHHILIRGEGTVFFFTYPNDQLSCLVLSHGHVSWRVSM